MSIKYAQGLPRLSSLSLAVTLSILTMNNVHADDFSYDSTANNLNGKDQNTMVVTASGFDEDVTKAAASVTVISNKTIHSKPYYTVLDVLRDVPGVFVTGSVGSEEITMRGMASDYTLILVDGKKVDMRETVDETTTTGYQFLPGIEAIDHIEVIRGPASSLYGSDAIGGVINIITKKANRKEWHGSITAGTTIQEHSRSGDINQTSAHLAGPLIEDTLSMKVDGTFQQRNEDDYDGGAAKRKLLNGGVGFTWTPNLDNIFDFDVTRALQETLATPKTSGGTTNHTYTRTNYTLSHKGYYGILETNSYAQIQDSTNSSSSITGRNTTLNTLEKLYLGDNHTFSFGGSFLNETIHDANNVLKVESGDPTSKLDRNSWALTAEDRWNVVDPFDVIPSLRLDENEKYGSHVTPKLYGVWTIAPQWTLKGGISGGYKNPTLRQSASNWADSAGSGQRDGVSIGNPDLKPETSTNYELGINWDSGRVKVGVTGFYSKFRNKIELETLCTGDAGTYTCDYNGEKYDFVSSYYNVSKAMMRGVESTFAWDILSNLHLNTSYTYTETKQESGEFAGQPLNQQPKHLVSARLDYDFSQNISPWLRVYYRGKTSEHYAGNSRSTETAGFYSYTVVDLGVNFQLTPKIKLNTSVSNLFDKYIDSDTYGDNQDGRRYNVSLTYNF
ncbi:TonB-dependent receptor domain-containing protein [Pantoea sp. AS-PWVM4]|uniref:TonB-dependent receptor domain-containing protein n=1 Tax=Pantoea sp. AS-PWVM4 TaxID=1332069 RepID=UPI000561357E|nr:TonB-dependent receptor [Pantoea sp. AS-PWVM4]